MNKPKLKVCWISAGVSSFVAGYLVRDTVDEFLYIPIKDQHEDSDRFIADCAIALGREIKRIKSEEYSCVGDVCRAFRFVNSAYGARCTEVLKSVFGKNGSLNIKILILLMYGVLIQMRKREQIT